MEIPTEAAVMVLPDVTLFPQSLLPIRIFEPRYQQMLADALERHRMFIVAMQKPQCVREAPSAVAGLGLIRVCVQNTDGTSHLILQGIQRVQLIRILCYKPYRIYKIRPLSSPPDHSPAVSALMDQVRNLVGERVALGKKKKGNCGLEKLPESVSVKEIVQFLAQVKSADMVIDLVSSALLTGGVERQAILETVELEPRLRLVHFLTTEIQRQKEQA